MTPPRVPKQVPPGLLASKPGPAADGQQPQALTLALLEAQGSDCECRVCRLLRTAVRGMSDRLLAESGA